MNAGKGAVLASLKSKMQTLRDELDGVKDQLDQKCKENEKLDEEKNQVVITSFLCTPHYTLRHWSFHFASFAVQYAVHIASFTVQYAVLFFIIAGFSDS